jgi:uncharacterized protein (DUF1015 family)
VPEVRPFTGLLYDPNVVGSLDAVTAPPYDIISPIDQDRYYRSSPYNVVRLILGKPEAGDHERHNEYTRASSYLRAWREEGALRPTDRPAYFPYEQRFHDSGVERTVRGLVAEVEIEPSDGSILAHERTMPGPLEDRLRLIREVRANLSPVYAVAGGPLPPVSEYLARAMEASAHLDMTDQAGTRHRLWVGPSDEGAVAAALRRDRLLIADGHHRYSVAVAYRSEMRSAMGSERGPWDAMMMLIVDGAMEDPPVLPIHRVALAPPPPEPDPGERVRDLAEVLASLHDDELTYGTVRLEDGEVVHRVARLDGDPPTVCALHAAVLDRDPQLPLRFVPDAVAAEEAVTEDGAPVAFLLPPTRVDRVRDVVERGGVLPQKSTYFWPKPRTGMVLRPLDRPGVA